MPDSGSVGEQRRRLLEAITLAETGWGRVHPNPLVGAVVVRGGKVVGRGAHREFGGPHAEVEALRAAGEAARGATLYVTLEPCDHQGKTPPCTAAILEAGIARVVYGAEDPHPQASGGAARLRSAGVEVVGGVERDAVRSQNAMFFHAVEREGPWLALKYALSLDARLSRTGNAPTAVTGERALEDVHRLRAGFDAILVGIGTALVDDPLLTVRGPVAARRPPLRVVLDSRARLPVSSRLVRSSAEAPVRVYSSTHADRGRLDALRDAGVDVRSVLPDRRGTLSLDAVLDDLAGSKVVSILCEGGGTLGAALLRADRVARLYTYIAPVLFGEDAVAAFPGSYGPEHGAGWRRCRVVPLGADLRVDYDRERPGG